MPAPPLPADELQRLQALYDLCLLDTPAEERFDRIVRTAARLFQVPIALVSLVDADRQWFKARHGLDATSTPRDVSFCAHVILQPDLQVVPDATLDARFADNPYVAGEPHIRFYAGHPLRAPNGRRVGTLCLVDFQVRHFSEEDRRTLTDLAAWTETELSALTLQEAREAISQQARLFELSSDLLSVVDKDTRLLRFSQSWTHTLGYSAEELQGMRLMDGVHPEDLPAVEEVVQRIVRGEPARRLELRFLARDGSWRWIQVSSTFNASEKTLYSVGRDITEQKRLEDERRRVEQLKNEFISTVSHELRTPLTSIRGALGLIEGGIAGPLSPEMAEMIRIAQSNSQRLLRLINDILDLEKMESGQLDLRLRPEELAELVSQAITSQRGDATQHDVRVEAVLEAPDARAVVDADRLIQVLTNLLSNAIKFSPPGERVRIRLERLEGRVYILVEDCGPGIPESFRERVFQKFAQADGSDTRSKGGTGLGLSISRTLVERMGGTLDFLTQEGAGTTFRVMLPEWRPEAPTARVSSRK
ncbi:GAF domain-containing sensor histidine kinase [Hyalangium gracile]|uniref:GAF domain-containing sensor histidine kinase n=1 Tax=Hyalangium gracile TaxID=394092 RepID=UPI001CCC1913|nr:ATP-binding protein [Hyalangium gracile]